MVTTCIARFNIEQFCIFLTLYLCFPYASYKKACVSLHSIHRYVILVETYHIVSEIRTETLYKI